MQPITPHLWFDTQAEEAVKLYVSLFPNSKILTIARYPKAAEEVSGKKAGSVMTVEFELNGQSFMALNGGPVFRFNESVSFMVYCESQEEIDKYWHALTADGGAEGQCGWLKDTFGVSWQIVPTALGQLMSGDPKRAERVTAAFLQMKKFDIQALEAAANRESDG